MGCMRNHSGEPPTRRAQATAGDAGRIPAVAASAQPDAVSRPSPPTRPLVVLEQPSRSLRPAPPDGTCYLARDEVSAFRERLGERLSALGLLTASEADSIMVSGLRVPRELRLADTCHGSAVSFGLTREIATVTPYAPSQQWAAAFHAAGMRGVRYESRFSTVARANAVAVFGSGGASDWPTAESRSGRAVAEDAGIRVLPRPRSRSLRLIFPPG
jgi:hypothetical protein